MIEADWLLEGAGQLVTLRGPERPRCGAELSELGLVEGGALAARHGLLVACGPAREVLASISLVPDARVVDAQGALVTPGFVDSHTHALFGRYRAEEYDLRVKGAAYADIAAAGGGIHASVEDFRRRTDGELIELSRPRLLRMLRAGSTTVEVKSGYGLSLDEELRALGLIARLDKELPGTLVPTFLGAHEIPPERRGDREAYVREICEGWLPAVAKQGIARFADVFCEPSVFSLEESRRILKAAAALGLGLKIHADEIAPGYGGAALAAELKAVSAEHLIVMAAGDMAALAASGTLAVLLPATSLGLAVGSFAPARAMIEAGIAPALATDFNPGSSCCESMGLVLSLACSLLKLTPAEALTAATHNGAWACGEGGRAGSLVPGKRADALIHDAADFRELPYHMGFDPVARVFASGREVMTRPAELRDRAPRQG